MFVFQIVSTAQDTSLRIVSAPSSPTCEVDDYDLPLSNEYSSDISSSGSSSATLTIESSTSISTPSVSEFTDSSSSDFMVNLFGYVPNPPPALPTYKLVGDNIDKEVHPRDMRSDHQSRSLHYFHSYAVKDRVDMSGISDVPTACNPNFDVKRILPTPADIKELRKNISILFSRVLKKHVPFIAEFGRGLERHIQHKFYIEMSQKSEVVSISLGYLAILMVQVSVYFLLHDIDPTWNRAQVRAKLCGNGGYSY